MSAPEPRLRVAVLSELPTPYRWPLYVKIAEAGAVDLTVLYYTRTEADRDWDLRAESRPGGPAVEYLEGRTFAVRGRRSLFFHWNPSVRARLRDGQFDVVVIPGWSMPTTLLAWATCRSRRIPYVVFSETNDRSPRPAWLKMLKRRLLRLVVARASAWLATGTLSGEFLAAHGADPARIFRFANTPDVAALRAAIARAQPNREALRRSLNTPDSGVVTLFVGRLIPAKDPETLLSAHALLEPTNPSAYLWIVGDGPLLNVLRECVADRKLERVRFLGSKRPDELPDVWAAADLFCLPSLHEPWGVVVNEAMAAGLPVVVSDRVGAGPDLVVGERNGCVVPAGDARQLADRLGAIGSDRALRTSMGRASFELINDWTYAPSVEGFERAVRAAAATRAGSPA